MYSIISDDPDSKPSPGVPSRLLAEMVAKQMSKKTGRKYRVVDLDHPETNDGAEIADEPKPTE